MYSGILKELEERNISKNQFCKDTGISKAYINKVLSGSTPMSERLFAAILSLPYLSDKLKEEITKTRFESKHGENYELLMFFNETAKDFEQSLVPKEIKEIELPNEGLVLSDKITIIRLTYSLAKYSIESGEVLFSNHTYDQEEIDNALYSAFYNRDEKKIETNFLHFIEKPHVFNKHYIKCIWAALRYGTINIKPLATEESLTSPLFPYALVCGKYTLLLNEKCDRAYFVCEPALSSAISENFLSLKKKSSPFIIVCVDEAEIMTRETSDCFNVASEKPVIVCSIPGACVKELTYDCWNEVVRKDLPKKEADFLIYSYLNYHHFQLENIQRHYILSDSLLEFAKSGEYASISHRYINSFPSSLRKTVIKNLKEAYKEKKNFIINSDKISFPNFVQIDYYPSSTRIHFDSVYRKFNIYNTSAIISHNDSAGSKKFFEALLAYQTGVKSLLTATQTDYTFESMLLLCGK